MLKPESLPRRISYIKAFVFFDTKLSLKNGYWLAFDRDILIQLSDKRIYRKNLTEQSQWPVTNSTAETAHFEMSHNNGNNNNYERAT